MNEQEGPGEADYPRILNGMVAGVSHLNEDGSDRQSLIRRCCHAGLALYLAHEPESEHDCEAVAVLAEKKGRFSTRRVQIGYLPREVAPIVVRHMSRGGGYEASIRTVYGGTAATPKNGVCYRIELTD